MTLTTTIDNETGARSQVVTGELTPEELLNALEQIYTGPDYQPEVRALWDLRGAQLHRFSQRDIRRVADFVAANRNAPPGTPAALVVGRTLDFGLARMYEQMLVASTEVRTKVFRDIDEARAWLKSAAEE